MMRTQGMVLLTTIGMIVLIAALFLSVLHATLLLSKHNQQLISKHHERHELEHAVNYFLTQRSLNQLKLCALKTIQHDLCEREWQHQVYVFEVFDLGVFQAVHDVSSARHHWLIKTRLKQIERPVLQLRVEIPVGGSCCHFEGLSWQLLA